MTKAYREKAGVVVMSVLVGDLMAAADEGYGSGGEGEEPRRKSWRIQKGLPPKRMGELSELDFLRKAMGMGMIVSKPWGDSYRYDFVCDANGKLWRTQVRSTEERFGARGYAVHASVYVGRKNLWFYPDGSKKGAMFEKWREAWWVMMGRKRRTKS